jgi:hypothetical protein
MFRRILLATAALLVAGAVNALPMMPVELARTVQSVGLEACAPAPTALGGGIALGLKRALESATHEIVFIDV